MRLTILKVTDSQVWFNIPEPVPEVIILPSFEGSIAPKRIPYGVKRIRSSLTTYNKLTSGAIPSSLTHLCLNQLIEGSIIPPSVRHLFLFNFRKETIALIPKTVTHLYIHYWDHEKAPSDRIHYLFAGLKDAASEYVRCRAFDHAEEQQETFFDGPFWFVKRIPKLCELTVGKTYTELIISDSETDTLVIPEGYKGPIRPGSIPKTITKLDLHNCLFSDLGEDFITDSVTHLFLFSITKQTVIPASVTHLAVEKYCSDTTQYIPSTVTHLYIHISYQCNAPPDRAHYLFWFEQISNDNPLAYKTDKLDASGPHSDMPFECIRSAFKREPREPAVLSPVTMPPSQAATEIANLRAQVAALTATINKLADAVGI